MVEHMARDREVTSSNPTHDKFFKYVNPLLKTNGGVKPQQNRSNNNNNNKNKNNTMSAIDHSEN